MEHPRIVTKYNKRIKRNVRFIMATCAKSHNMVKTTGPAQKASRILCQMKRSKGGARKGSRKVAKRRGSRKVVNRGARKGSQKVAKRRGSRKVVKRRGLRKGSRKGGAKRKRVGKGQGIRLMRGKNGWKLRYGHTPHRRGPARRRRNPARHGYVKRSQLVKKGILSKKSAAKIPSARGLHRRGAKPGRKSQKGGFFRFKDGKLTIGRTPRRPGPKRRRRHREVRGLVRKSRVAKMNPKKAGRVEKVKSATGLVRRGPKPSRRRGPVRRRGAKPGRK